MFRYSMLPCFWPTILLVVLLFMYFCMDTVTLHVNLVPSRRPDYFLYYVGRLIGKISLGWYLKLFFVKYKSPFSYQMAQLYYRRQLSHLHWGSNPHSTCIHTHLPHNPEAIWIDSIHIHWWIGIRGSCMTRIGISTLV